MKITPSHAAFEADFKAFLDGELPPWRRLQLRRHLKSCPACRKEIREMQLIETELKEETAPLGGDLRSKILDAAPSESPKIEAPKTAPLTRPRLTPRLVFGLGSLAVLGALIMAPPFFGRARENARRSSLQSNMKQIGLGISQYSQDYDEKFPAAGAAAAGGSFSAGAASSAEPIFARRGESKSRYRNDVTSPDLRGDGSKIYLDDVVPAQRQVHKQGSISVAVDDAEAKGSATEILVKNVGGFVAQNALSTGEGGRKTATLDVRVPVAQFESIVAKIGKLGVVREKSVNGEDITQRVVGAGTQQQSLARELSIREAQLRAANPKKAAERQSIVADVRSLRFQANQARAQLEYLKKYAALATLFVTLQDKPKAAPVAGATSELGQTARAAWSSFFLSARLPLQLLIWIAAYAPLWIPALLVWRKFGRKWMSAA